MQQGKDWTLSRRAFIKRSSLLAACALLGGGANAALSGCSVADRVIMHSTTIIDDAGREIAIPTADSIKSVFFTSGLAQVYVEALAPDLVGCTCGKYTAAELEFLPEGIEKKPYLGTLHENQEFDREQLLVEDIDIMFSISGVALTRQNISEAEEVQEQTGIPVVLVDGTFGLLGHVFRFLGEIFERQKRAEELATYVDGIVTEVFDAVAKIPENEKLRVYYAEGPEGLQTEPETSQHMSAFLAAGAIDVADCDETYGGGMTDVSLEQVLRWDPDVIVAWGGKILGGAYEDILTNRDWADIKAVKDGYVFECPALPWCWCDRPPGVNRVMGLQWIANVLYPDYFDVDIAERTIEYFKMMLDVDISRERVEELLGRSYPSPLRKNA